MESLAPGRRDKEKDWGFLFRAKEQEKVQRKGLNRKIKGKDSDVGMFGVYEKGAA